MRNRQLLVDYFTGGGPAVPGSQEVDVISLDYLPPPPLPPTNNLLCTYRPSCISLGSAAAATASRVIIIIFIEFIHVSAAGTNVVVHMRSHTCKQIWGNRQRFFPSQRFKREYN
jgi:hypothetical protein